MIRYEKKFGVTGKELTLNEEQSKKVATLLFITLGCVFMILGGIGVATARFYLIYGFFGAVDKNSYFKISIILK